VKIYCQAVREYWLNEILENADATVEIMLLGNKADLNDSR